MPLTEELHLEDLAAWDWQAELRAQERSYGWLARKTGRSPGAVSRYSHGTLPTPIEWLRAAAAALGVKVAA